ncbi:MAG: M1 family metallopeptidase [Acidobacteriota bacterium]
MNAGVVLRRLAFLPVLWTAVAPLAAGAEAYRIEARLLREVKVLEGRAEIQWRNTARVPVDELRFHLYFNAWRDRNSSFLSRAGRWVRMQGLRPEDWGGIEVPAIRVFPARLEAAAGASDLVQDTAFIQPDDGNPYDRTVWQVRLQRPVEPDEVVEIRLDFRTKIPRTFARTGFRGDYFFLAHWFPKLGVIEPDGTWNCHQFIQTEFFSDFSRYDVSLTVPKGWVLGATGQLVGMRENGEEAVHRYVAERVHEFAWVTCPEFREYERTFTFEDLPAVKVRLLLMPDHEGQQERYFAATEAALRYYGEWFGPYPYGYLTVVDPAYRSGSGGMEYPTLFTGGTRWLNPEGSGSPEGVTVHECGHQFWYGLVANNEFEHAWLDEGFNTYSTERVMETVFRPTFLVDRYLEDFVPLRFSDLPRSPRSASGLGGPHSPLKLDVMARPSWQYGPGAYRVNSYTKPALMLLTLERLLGWETFQKVLATYFQRFTFGHPKPEDFRAVLEEVTGRDFSWFWAETLDSSNVFDYAVEEVATRREGQEVLIRRWGEAVFPVEVRIVFESGEEVKERWDGRDRWRLFRYERADPVVRVEIDPEEVLALDVRRSNNSWVRSAPTAVAATKWAAKWMVWFQHLLEFFAFAG